MKLYINNVTDPYFNLASEQYLLDTEEDDVLMFWRNERSVIVGRNQNTYAEIDRAFTEKNGIKVVRRLTGGGAVFHDLGNVNFSMIVSKASEVTDFGSLSAPIVKILRDMGVPAVLSGRNDLTADGRKFSGLARCIYKNRILHHGTLLFNADLSTMEGALRVDPEKIKSKGIKSVRARVCNLSEYLPEMSAEEFKKKLEDSVPYERVEFSGEQIKGIEKLRDEKYAAFGWNYGVSKEYGKTVSQRFDYGGVQLSYSAENGVLTSVRFSGDYFGQSDIEFKEKELTGVKLLPEEILPHLADIGKYISGAQPEQILELFIK